MQTILYMLADFNIPLMSGQEHYFFAASWRNTAGFTVQVFLDAGEIIQHIQHGGGRWLPLCSFPAVQKSVMSLKALTEESKAVNHLERQDKTSDDTKPVRNNMTNSYLEAWRSQFSQVSDTCSVVCQTEKHERRNKGERVYFLCMCLLLDILQPITPASNALYPGGSSRCQMGPVALNPSSLTLATTTAQLHLLLMLSACGALFL